MIALRSQSRYADAAAQVDQVLATDPSNRHARYSRGLVAMSEAKKGSRQYFAALQSLAALADSLPLYKQLPSTAQHCPETPKIYSVFNTVGISYAEVGDRARAEHYLLRGDANRDALLPDSRAKLYYNLGYFYTNNLNLKKASYYYGLAKSPAATEQMQAIRSAVKSTPFPK